MPLVPFRVPCLLLLTLAGLAASTTPALAGPIKSRVGLADVAAVGQVGVDSLAPAHHALAVAQIQEAGARAIAEKAEDEARQAKKDQDARESEVAAAKAEKKAASTSGDAARIQKADEGVPAAEGRLQVAKARVAWCKALVDATRAEVDLAEALVQVRDGEAELARAKLVTGADAALMGSRYAVLQYEKQLDDARAWHAKKLDIAARVRRDADIAGSGYKNLAPPTP